MCFGCLFAVLGVNNTSSCLDMVVVTFRCKQLLVLCVVSLELWFKAVEEEALKISLLRCRYSFTLACIFKAWRIVYEPVLVFNGVNQQSISKTWSQYLQTGGIWKISLSNNFLCARFSENGCCGQLLVAFVKSSRTSWMCSSTITPVFYL